MLGSRNQIGLDEAQTNYCIQAWAFLCGGRPRTLDTSQAHIHGSRTRFFEQAETTPSFVMLGADAYPGKGMSANSRLSVLACLAHEIAHAERFEAGYDRPFSLPDNHVDEAETSLRASFTSVLGPRDREDLIEDAKDRLTDWLTHTRKMTRKKNGKGEK